MDHLTKLPNELKVQILQNLTDANDVAKLNLLNNTFRSFYKNFAKDLARFDINTVELRGSEQLYGKNLISFNLYRKTRGVDQLWKFSNYVGLDVSSILEWSSRVILSNDLIQLRIYNIVISSKNLSSIIKFIRSLLPKNFKKGQFEFKIYLAGCDFYEMDLPQLTQFFDFFISLGVKALILEDIPSFIISDLCNALAKTGIHLVDTFRLHVKKGDNLDNDTALLNLLTSISRVDRLMTKLIIDGHPVPLLTIADFISEFCANPHVDVAPSPPYIRCFFSINNQMSISDVKDLREMAHIRINSRKRRSQSTHKQGAKRFRTQIFVEFGYYEEDLPLTQSLHAVIGLSVNEWTHERRLSYN